MFFFFFFGGGGLSEYVLQGNTTSVFLLQNVRFNSMCYLPFLVSFSRENCFKVKNNNSVTFLQIKKSPITRDKQQLSS